MFAGACSVDATAVGVGLRAKADDEVMARDVFGGFWRFVSRGGQRDGLVDRGQGDSIWLGRVWKRRGRNWAVRRRGSQNGNSRRRDVDGCAWRKRRDGGWRKRYSVDGWSLMESDGVDGVDGADGVEVIGRKQHFTEAPSLHCMHAAVRGRSHRLHGGVGGAGTEEGATEERRCRGRWTWLETGATLSVVAI